MAVLSDYTSGTITLANGSTAVTGTGTLFQTAQLKEGDTLQIQNLTAVIASVNSNTSLTLTEPWTGVALTNAPYRARFMPDGSRQTSRATTMIELVGNGVLSNLAELGVEDGKTPVGNAAGEYELQDYLDDPNGSLGKLAALTLEANKALTTDDSGNAQQIDLGTLGRALLALATGTNAQYVRGDGTLQTLNAAAVGLGNVNNTSDADKPVSTATQTALNGKFGTSGGTLTGGVNITSNADSAVRFLNTNSYGYTVYFNSGNGTTDNGLQVVHSSGGLIATFLYNRSLAVVGALSKGSGTFLIDHPLDPLNKNLRHGFVESTEYVNIYRGMIDLVDGRMTVDIDAAFGMMDGTFAALNADVMVSSLQNQFGKDRVWVEAPADSGKFTIICEDPVSTATVAWVVTGRRKDAFVCSDLDPNTDSDGRFIPEFDKPEYIEQEANHA
ncbi:hypothetical protein CQ052_15275 [Ochrobactrum sp. MYb15]|uniref:hypothetical protein n=1 Tax=Brucella pituitosa TaxID=571256 RepID=UPI000CFB0922|nr:hypothetical protein CQZ90_08400 [Ochrobactrum sp. MYb19]PRA55566.1 hypothetical protein CQ062_11980 [Ochrobactrum sp. MYb68]PRA68636.1 hypothetical protein CQ053_03390 [Ochrobactrum sp. MYb18]PRA74136.1 hypothetical protein CQ049_12690 [Brucella thiophenivorans]PRA90888.1 hypothetical protein CQ051_13295 [Ochrobactrum sp. MYb14]PRA96339.1 hypothetical protein CQ052_15275 [Ochrobactrum sp. MYb15]